MRLIIEPIVRAALLEDLGRSGDITTEAIVPEEAEVGLEREVTRLRASFAPALFAA